MSRRGNPGHLGSQLSIEGKLWPRVGYPQGLGQVAEQGWVRLAIGIALHQGGDGGQAGSPLGGTVILKTPIKQASAQMN